MRPVSLRLQGFGAFREPVELSFEGADFFALVGPTGAGKSTVIDAICFALYGSVPRYGDEKIVGRAVSLGRQEAKVSLTFDIGAQRYAATRVVRVRNGRATTSEALLERLDGTAGSHLLAGSAKEMKPAVERLLGLPFAHFTKCVVLPQGEFARFLHDEPARRRELLGRLLDLQVYERVGQLARQRASALEGTIALADRQRAELAHATPEARAEAERRERRLFALARTIDETRAEITRLTAACRERAEAVEREQAVVSALAGMAVPEELASFASDLGRAEAADADARRALDRARTGLAALETQVEALPDRGALERARDAHRALAELAARTEEARAAAAAAQEDRERAARAAAAADAAVETAQAALDDARAAHAAHALAARLTAGEPCPVCEQPVAVVHRRRAPAAVSGAERALDAAKRRAASARRALDEANRALAQADAALRGLGEQEAALRAAAGDHPDPGTVDAELARVETVVRAHAQARRAEQEAQRRADEAAAALADLDARRREWSNLLTRAREAFVRHGLEPPPPEGDVTRDWDALVSWCRSELARREEALAAREAELADARHEHDAAVVRVVADARDAGVDTPGDDLDALRDRVLAAHGAAARELGGIDDAIERAAGIDREAAAAREELAVAAALGQVMRSDRFPRWLMAEALEALVAEASTTLHALSSGQFSLRYGADDEFLVVDHANADETRSVRTLSGGETFQASLALALALSDQLAHLSAGGGTKLEAIFLDEGFGTLDAETLDVVAGTIETLGASGRMVGIVTHVPELAERVPVRFRVARTDSGARVTREEG